MYMYEDQEFEIFCEERYQRYLLACEVFGITGAGTYQEFKANNIDWLEREYNLSPDKTYH
jgi:hypothetical protein